MIEIFTDGASRGNPGESAWAFIAYENDKLIYSIAGYIGTATNNVAEYTAVEKASEWINNYPDKKLIDFKIYVDSQLVAQQLNGCWKVKNRILRQIYHNIMDNLTGLGWLIEHTSRDNNSKADKLCNDCLDRQERLALKNDYMVTITRDNSLKVIITQDDTSINSQSVEATL